MDKTTSKLVMPPVLKLLVAFVLMALGGSVITTGVYGLPFVIEGINVRYTVEIAPPGIKLIPVSLLMSTTIAGVTLIFLGIRMLSQLKGG